MPRETFDRDLRRLQDELLVLGSVVERALAESVRALKYRDHKRARQVIAEDRLVNSKRYAIEAEVLALIATQQPMATDLRTLAAVLEIAGELERIGDYAKGIGRIQLMLGPEPLMKPLIDLPIMAERAGSMLHRALDAFVRRDVALAQAIPEEDDEVDALYQQVYRELITYVIDDPSTIEQSNCLLWAAHNLERAADRVTNICERTIFTATGRLIEMDHEESLESLG
ncbi:MAG: phosphate signaling complex protein PhoU [Anaerolineae bacterium]|nr:phosphate signaling complex protein PhoU [Anaerolineae bacterium]